MMDYNKIYVLEINGKRYSDPFTSKRTLDETLAILKRFEPDAVYQVFTFKLLITSNTYEGL